MKTIINALDKEVTIDVFKNKKGIYWAYEGVNQKYGPFRNDQQAINDAKLYSMYGTVSKAHIWGTFSQYSALLRLNNDSYWLSIR